MGFRRGLTDAIGDALFLLEWAAPRATRRVHEWARTMADAVRPNPPMTIRSSDGQILTGLLVVDAGDVILFVGTRTPPSNGTPAPRPDPFAGPPHRDGAIPLWPPREVDLRDFDDGYRRR